MNGSLEPVRAERARLDADIAYDRAIADARRAAHDENNENVYFDLAADAARVYDATIANA